MDYTKEFFGLQLEFAEHISFITGISLGETLLEYTSLYKAFKITDWEFNPRNSAWKDFVDKLDTSDDKLETIYQYYLENKTNEPSKKLFGCFNYNFEEKENYIQLHFSGNNNEPLSIQNVEIRKAELKEMFQDIKKNHLNVLTVPGFSWLYNLDSYKRLFPQEYIENTKVKDGWFKTLAIWGQFIDYKGNLKMDTVSKFKTYFYQKKSLSEVLKCFQYYVLEPEAEIGVFYNFFGI
jgi:hypothetical protein